MSEPTIKGQGGFADNSLTKKGALLISKKLASGEPIKFTKIVLGDGYMPEGQTPAGMTAVVSPVVEVPISKAALTEDGYAVIGGRYSNETQEDPGFEWRELGLYATDPDDGEILYSYGNSGEPAEFIPPSSSTTLVEKLIDIVTYVGNDAKVDAVFGPYVADAPDEVTLTVSNHVWSVKAGGLQLSHAAKVDVEGGFASWDAVKQAVENGTLDTITNPQLDQWWGETPPYDPPNVSPSVIEGMTQAEVDELFAGGVTAAELAGMSAEDARSALERLRKGV